MRFDRITLHTPQTESVKQFYAEVLRLPVVADDNGRITFAAGATALQFVRDDAIESTLYHVAFNIPENQIESCMEWAQKRFELAVNPGTGRTLVHFPNWNAHSIYFRDPAGNLLEFIARHTLPSASDRRFEMPRDLLCISELGVATADVARIDAELTQRLGLARYNPPADGKLPNDFRAMGDENGLFIVVRRNRRWFMTDQGASAFPAEVQISCNRAAEFELSDTLCRVHTVE